MFALLKLKEQELQSRKAAQVVDLPLNTNPQEEVAPTPSNHQPTSPIEERTEHSESRSEHEDISVVKSSQGKQPTSDEEGWMEIDRNKVSASPAHELKFLPNKLIKVPLDQLVWAPLPRWRGPPVYCPGRISSYNESLLDPNLVDKNINADDIVVIEFFGQEDLSNTWLRNLIEEKKVYPYWAASKKDNRGDYEPEQFKIWNKKAFDRLQQGLEKKMKTKSDAKKMFEHIYSTAQDFLRLAKEAEKERNAPIPPVIPEAENEDEADFISPPITENGSSKSKKAKNQPKKSLADIALANHDDSNKPPPQLRVGDKVRYINPMFPDKKSYSRIIGFDLDDKQHPLILADDMVLDLQDFVAHVSSTYNQTPQTVDTANDCEVIDIDLCSPVEPVASVEGERKRPKRKFGKSPPESKIVVEPAAELPKPTPKKKYRSPLSSASAPTPASVGGTPAAIGQQQEGRLIALSRYELIDEDGRSVFKKKRSR